MKRALLILAASGLMVACENGSPTEPEPAAVPAPQQDPQIAAGLETWSLDWTPETVEGPESCFVSELARGIGNGYENSELILERDGSSVLLYESWAWEIGWVFSGTIEGRQLSATGPSPQMTWKCDNGTTVGSELSITLAGRFSNSWQRLEAVETRIYRLAAGDEVSATFRWNAVRVKEN